VQSSPGRRWLHPTLLAIFALVWAWAAWDPIHRSDWLLENLLVFASVPVLVWSYFRFRLSDTAYVLIFLFMTLHVVGSHWTYSNVPWPDWRAMGFERNQYDRVVHLSYGLLLVLPAREVLVRLTRRDSAATSYFGVEFILASSALYEVIEWITALVVAPDLGAEFLGSQGDPFDAVADMALAGLGALVVVLGWHAFKRRHANPVTA
jgi:putative membrane protein